MLGILELNKKILKKRYVYFIVCVCNSICQELIGYILFFFMFVGEFRLFINLVFWIYFYSRKQLFLKCVESLIEQNKYLNKIVKEVIRKVYVYSKQRLGIDINVKSVVIDVGNGYW